MCQHGTMTCQSQREGLVKKKCRGFVSDARSAAPDSALVWFDASQTHFTLCARDLFVAQASRLLWTFLYMVLLLGLSPCSVLLGIT